MYKRLNNKKTVMVCFGVIIAWLAFAAYRATESHIELANNQFAMAKVKTSGWFKSSYHVEFVTENRILLMSGRKWKVEEAFAYNLAAREATFTRTVRMKYRNPIEVARGIPKYQKVVSLKIRVPALTSESAEAFYKQHGPYKIGSYFSPLAKKANKALTKWVKKNKKLIKAGKTKDLSDSLSVIATELSKDIGLSGIKLSVESIEKPQANENTKQDIVFKVGELLSEDNASNDFSWPIFWHGMIWLPVLLIAVVCVCKSKVLQMIADLGGSMSIHV